MEAFEYFLSTKIQFGEGTLVPNLQKILKEKEVKKVLVVTDQVLMELQILDGLLGMLDEQKIWYRIFRDVEPNPRVETVDKCRDLCLEESCDLIIAVGGGSVMDTAKGAAVLCTNSGSIHDYLAGRKEDAKAIVNPSVPVIAVPTTSGTGAEVSDCIVVIDTNHIKDLMIADELAPAYALLDPTLTYKVPAGITANTGLDVLGHALEAYTSEIYSPIAQLMALEAIRIVFGYLPDCVNHGGCEARNKMAYASLLAGVAQSKCGCTVPHALSCPLTVYYKVPHGLGVGIGQIPAIEYNRDIIPEKYQEVLKYLNIEAEQQQAPDILIQMIKKLFQDIGVNEYLELEGITEEELNKLARDSMADDGVEVNPRKVTENDMKGLFQKIIRRSEHE